MNTDENQLFSGIPREQVEQMLPCLEASRREFSAGRLIYSYQSGKTAAILLKGTASVVRYEANGSRTILESLGEGGIFGAGLDFHTESLGSVHVICDSSCQVLFLNYEKMIRPCRNACPRHLDLVQNILSILSRKSRLLGERVEVLSRRSIREKLLCYFSIQAKNGTFTLPFTLSALADYIGSDRSAMMRELRKLRQEGLVQVDGRRVTLRTHRQQAG